VPTAGGSSPHVTQVGTHVSPTDGAYLEIFDGFPVAIAPPDTQRHNAPGVGGEFVPDVSVRFLLVIRHSAPPKHSCWSFT
jgi:hypothetical protein